MPQMCITASTTHLDTPHAVAVVFHEYDGVGVDRALHESEAGDYVERVSPGASPSKLIGGIGFWVIFLFVLTAALSALKIPSVTTFMNQVLAYLPNVIAAVLIFVLAAVIAGAIGGLVAKLLGDTPTGKVVATAVPALVMVIAVFMILNQLKIAPEIVTITYAALIGAVALGSALAFGLGGRDVTPETIEDIYWQTKSNDRPQTEDIWIGLDQETLKSWRN